jgi:uncharacterized protein (TIGR03435 family)
MAFGQIIDLYTGGLMKKQVLRGFLAMVLLSGAALGQASANAPLPKFEVADVQAAPYRSQPFANGGVMHGDRYLWHQAALVNLIAAAYGVNVEMVVGGPSWLEQDRFEVVGKADPKTPPAQLKLMLRSLLTERFGLVLHEGEVSMPAYVLTVGKDGKTKMKQSAGDGTEGCDSVDTGQAAMAPFQLKCHDMSMEVLASQLHDMGNGYFPKPVVDKTGLTGTWDFEMKWHSKPVYEQLGPADGISIFDAVEKQLGLKLTLETSPQHVWIVDSANHKPVPNGSEVARELPPPPPAVFDVAIIKPSAADERPKAQFNGGQVAVQNLTLKFLMNFAWDFNLNSDDYIVGAPKWFGDNKYDILAKVIADPANPSANKDIDFEDLRPMLRALITERFSLKSHMEDRPIPGYTLYVATSKMKQADPNSRTKCYEGPGPDGKDPRLANAILNRLVTCQNMSAADISVELQRVAGGYIYGPVLDKTGLAGGWDFTLSFSSSDRTNGLQRGDSTDSSDPSGALTLYEAVSRQLGLKLVKEKRPTQVLVIDHMDEKPTEN